MKAWILIIITLLLFFQLNLISQVTMGLSEPPTKGSILDLREHAPDANNATASKGLLLPRVILDSISNLRPAVANASPAEKLVHTGLTVFHVGTPNICKGVYTWNGEKWETITDLCKITLDCSSVAINGQYTVGTPLGASNTITLTINATNAAIGGTYNIYTDQQNGISFASTGSITGDTQTITLNGSGTPLSGGASMTFIIQAEFSNSSSSDNATCSITTPDNIVPIAQAGIFGFGYYNNYFGYTAQTSGSSSMINSPNNFGTAVNSTVNSSGFNHLGMLALDGITPSNFLNTALWASDPDIILNGYHSYTTSSVVIDSLANYLERGGILIMFDEYSTAAYSITVQLMKKLCPIQAASITTSPFGVPGSVYTMTNTVDDDITNGPFGNVLGQKWGEDASTTRGFSGLPADSIIAYSTLDQSGTTYVTMFRHKRLNLFFVGDGGFISNDSNYKGDNYGSTTICPFAIDNNNSPIVRRNWGSGGSNLVYNSIIFANVMYWASKHSRSNNRSQ
ncbi:MAG: hypothetical protein ACK5KT_05460 [Dysgonomonas sp.]